MPSPRRITTTSTSYPKGGPARTTIKQSNTSQSFWTGNITRNTTTSLDGVVTGRGSTVSSSGGGGAGGLIGPILILIGLFLLWIAFRGKSPAFWNALTGDTGFDARLDSWANAKLPSSSGQQTGTGSSAPVTGNTTDSGTHMGIDPSGAIVVINKAYADMTGAEKDAANAYAHQIGNIG